VKLLPDPFQFDQLPDKDPKKYPRKENHLEREASAPKRVSVDPHYMSTDKYRRVIKPIDAEEFFTS